MSEPSLTGHAACPLDCSDSCSWIVRRTGSGRLAVAGNPDHPFTRGRMCKKGVRFFQRLNDPARITAPLIKENGRFQECSWDTALELCAERIGRLGDRPEAMLHLHGFAYRGPISLASTHFFRRLGASSTSGSLCDETGIAASMADFGRLDHNDPADLMNAELLANWGRDLSRSSPHLERLLSEARDKGLRIVSISPGGDDSDKYSDETIRIRPGTDRFLAAAVIRLLLESGAVDPTVLAHGRDPERFLELIRRRPVASLLEACDVPLSRAELLREWYGRPSPLATLIGWGVQRHVFGGQNVRMINGLAFVSGNVGRAGGGVYYNISSHRPFNLDWVRPDPGGRKLPLSDLGRAVLRARDPAIEFIWVDGFNPVNQVPDAGSMARAIESRFTVVSDAFMTDTALRADLVLPCALGPEYENIVGSCLHNHAQHGAKLFAPPGQARPDLDILADLGRRLDPPLDMPGSEEILRASLDSPLLGLDLETMRKKGFARAKVEPVAFAGLKFGHADGKFCFADRLDPEPSPEPGFPLKLLSLVNRDYIHSQIPEDHQQDRPTAFVSPDSPGLDGIDTDRPVFLASPLGRIRIELGFDPGLHPLAVIVRRGHWLKNNRGLNLLVSPKTTDMGGGSAYYSQDVRLEN